MDKKILEATTSIREYMHMHHTLQQSDAILVCGSSDSGVAYHAANVFKQGYADIIICSGGFGKITKDTNNKSESEIFAAILINEGIPETAILYENESTNTGDNITFSMKTLQEYGIRTNTIIIIDKPYKERRSYATAKKRFPTTTFLMSSDPVLFPHYSVPELSEEMIVSLMVGDLQRIKEYPKLGFQIAQDIPSVVEDAYDFLIEQGYTKYLIP